MSSTKIRTLLAELQTETLEPIRIASLHDEWYSYVAADAERTSQNCWREFLDGIVRNILNAVNYDYVRDAVLGGVKNCRESFESLDYARLLTRGGDGTEKARFLNSEFLDRAILYDILVEIYAKSNECADWREAVSHYLGQVRHAETYLKAVREAIVAFLLDSQRSLTGWNGKLDHQVQVVCVDLDATLARFAALRADLTQLDKSLSGRLSLMDQFESSLRLLNQSAHQEGKRNASQSRYRTTAPQPIRFGEDDGCSVEPVPSRV